MIPVILASASSSRAAVLRAAGVEFTIKVSGVDEEALKVRLLADGYKPGAIAEALAEAKALAVSRTTPGLVIGADQTLDLDGRLFDKTSDLAATRTRLQMLRGRTHRLHAAVAIAQHGQTRWRAIDTASLTVRDFSDAFIEDYLSRCGEAVVSSVGAYHLEGRGAQLFNRIEGDYFTVLGLPLIPLLSCLRELGGLAA